MQSANWHNETLGCLQSLHGGDKYRITIEDNVISSSIKVSTALERCPKIDRAD